MKTLRKWMLKQKLNVKFTITIGIIVIIPVTCIFSLLFHNMKRNEVQKALSNMEYEMNQSYGEIKKTVDLCNMSAQFFLNTPNLNSFLIKLKENVPMETIEMVEFYKEDIGMMERLVNSNPYLYQVRVYADNHDFSEMMPILYQKERLLQLPWADDFTSGEWQFDYKDEIFPESTNNSSQHMMSLVTMMEDYEAGDIGVLEVAVRMDHVFPEVFQADDESWACFIDKKGRVYTNSGSHEESRWEKKSQDIIEYIYPENPDKESYKSAVFDGETLIVGYYPVKELSGCLIQLVSVQKEMDVITSQRNLALSLLLAAFVCLIFLINIIVKILLKNFYKILDTIRQMQKGDLNATVTDCGPDEMGELGNQINKMLDNIKHLIDENINRGLLMKNSEIRALQNQINAHFIYNVLESIKMMAEIDEKYEISDAVTSLGKLLRYSMKWTNANVTIRQEIDYIRNYLDLINLRFDYEIILSLNIPDMVYDQEIPKMSLQPVIENAIYHGIEEAAQDSCIYIKAFVEEKDFTIEITDSGKGMTEQQLEDLQKKISGELEVGGGSGNGIGLKNVQDRIHISYGEEYGIAVASKIDCYTKVIIKLPLTKGSNHQEQAEGSLVV